MWEDRLDGMLDALIGVGDLTVEMPSGRICVYGDGAAPQGSLILRGATRSSSWRASPNVYCMRPANHREADVRAIQCEGASRNMNEV